MQVNQCDRCGKIFDGNKEGGVVSLPHSLATERNKELCPACVVSLERWFKTPEPYAK